MWRDLYGKWCSELTERNAKTGIKAQSHSRMDKNYVYMVSSPYPDIRRWRRFHQSILLYDPIQLHDPLFG